MTQFELFKQSEAVRLGVTVEQVEQILELAVDIDGAFGFTVSSYDAIASIIKSDLVAGFSKFNEAVRSTDLHKSALDKAEKPESQVELCNRLIKDLHRK